MMMRYATFATSTAKSNCALFKGTHLDGTVHELDVPQADLADLGNARPGLGDARGFRGGGSDLRQQDGGG
jgi:hypothetical protein